VGVFEYLGRASVHPSAVFDDKTASDCLRL
jgi:hypothetical protein